jgi:hypothetical protein
MQVAAAKRSENGGFPPFSVANSVDKIRDFWALLGYATARICASFRTSEPPDLSTKNLRENTTDGMRD